MSRVEHVESQVKELSPDELRHFGSGLLSLMPSYGTASLQLMQTTRSCMIWQNVLFGTMKQGVRQFCDSSGFA